MKILILGSMSFAKEMKEINDKLLEMNQQPQLPVFIEEYLQLNSQEEMHSAAIKNKQENDLFTQYYNMIKENDAILIVNNEKKGIPNYIGSNSLIEMSFARLQGKKIYLFNDIPEADCKEEIIAMKPQTLKGNLDIFEDKKVDVETKAFIDENKYNELQGFFVENAHLKKEDYQETTYLNCEQDLRLEKNKDGCKVLLKKENQDQVKSEEEKIEIRTSEEGFKKFIDMFDYLEYKPDVKWIRDRKEFDWHGIKVILDNIKGYGYIIELEKTVRKSQKQETLEELRQKLQELDIEPTPKEVFEQKLQEYKNNWQEILQEC